MGRSIIIRRAARAVPFLVAVCSTQPVFAGDPAAAEALFEEGRRLVENGQTELGCAKLQASWDEEASVGTMLNLARCHQTRGKTATAWRAYKKAADLAERLADDERAALARELADELAPQLARVTIEVPHLVVGMVVTQNGVPVGRDRLGSAEPVDPGAQRIEVTAPGRKPWSTDLVLTEGAQRRIVVPRLEPLAPPATPPNPEPPLAVFVAPHASSHDRPDEGLSTLGHVGIALAAVGVAGLATGIAFGTLAASNKDAALPHCPNNGCNALGFDLIEDARDQALGSTVALVAGGALLTGGVVMLVVDVAASSDANDEATASAHITPRCSLDGCGLLVGGAF